jgi:hypothetical protein
MNIPQTPSFVSMLGKSPRSRAGLDVVPVRGRLWHLDYVRFMGVALKTKFLILASGCYRPFKAAFLRTSTTTMKPQSSSRM